MLEMVDLVFSDSLGNLLNLLPVFGEKMSILYQILDVISIMQAGNKTGMQFFLCRLRRKSFAPVIQNRAALVQCLDWVLTFIFHNFRIL